MKNVATSLLLACAFGAHADNPIISHRYLADPTGFLYGDRLYAICSNDDENGNGYDMKGSVLISTKDMANWTDHGEVYYSPKDGSWGTTAYAPTAVTRDGKVYYYVPNAGSAIGVLVADRPEGPLRDPNKKALITGNLCDGVAWCFDPHIFVDDDGQAYLVYGGGSSSSAGFGQNIRIIKINKDMVSVSGSPVKLSLEQSFEGPFLHKYKGKYYLSYPMNGSSNIGLSISSTPMSGYVYKGSILDNPSLDGKNINGNNNSHESMLEYEGQWYMFYHDRRLSNGGTYKRNVSVEKMSYKDDGSINKVIVTKGIAQTRSFNPFDSIAAVTYSKQYNISAWMDVNNTGIRRINLLVPRKSGAWMRISSADFGTGAKQFVINGGGNASSASVEIRVGSETGTVAGTCTIEKTGSWKTLKTSTCDVAGLSGVKDVYLKFVGTDSNTVFDWWRFVPSSTSIHRASTPDLPVATEYRIHDLHGRLVRTISASPSTQASEVWAAHRASLPTGTYIVSSVAPSATTSKTFVKLSER